MPGYQEGWPGWGRFDQHAPEKSAHIGPFLNSLAATSVGAIEIARRVDAMIFLVFTWREGGIHRIEVSSPIDREKSVNEIIDAYHRRLESLIRERPQQWLWLHRRWKVSKPGPDSI